MPQGMALLGPEIQAKFNELNGRGAPIGCVVTEEADLLVGNGTFAKFENGQIVFSPDKKLVVAAYTDNAGALVVDWNVTDQYTYNFFLVRATRIDQPDYADPSHNTSQQTISAIAGTSGVFVYPAPPFGRLAGTYSIEVEGCDDAFAGSSSCRQGWSNPVVVDTGFVDVAHRADGISELPSASTPAEAAATLDDRARIGDQWGCPSSFGSVVDEPFTFIALAKLHMAVLAGPGDCAVNNAHLMDEVNKALVSAKVTTEVGTDVSFGQAVAPGTGGGAAAGCAAGGAWGSIAGPLGALGGCLVGGFAGAAAGFVAVGLPCAAASEKSGDYDMALRGLIPIMYEFGNRLDEDARLNVLNNLLNQKGGVDQVRLTFHICGLTVDETENHILVTESSRYLTNQLRMAEVAKSHPPGSLEYEAARKTFDNSVNKLEDWMLTELQGFLKRDFHEYNARPYARLSVMALRNLADYAESPAVKEEARMVLDYLAAKFAVSSSGLRRSAPFRRRNERINFAPLFSSDSDEQTWYFMTMAGDTDAINSLQQGHANWSSAETMAYSGLGTYRVPDLIIQTMIDKSTPYFQVFRHEGVELYASTNSFLISSGGDFEPSEPRDRILGIDSKDTRGSAIPTVLVPRSFGISRDEMIRIEGDLDPSKRTNTCVAPGFACGLNLRTPDHYVNAYHKQPRPCDVPVMGAIKDEWLKLRGDYGELGCPINSEQPNSDGNGTFQEFEHGKVVFSAAQHMVVAAWQHKGEASAVSVDWAVLDTFHYDFFIVNWGRFDAPSGIIDGGQTDVQSDSANATTTSGRLDLPSAGLGGGLGTYTVQVEGCDSRPFQSSRCNQRWSSPIKLDLPFNNACARVLGKWIFIDSTLACMARPADGKGLNNRGFYVATYSDSASRLGLFEAVDFVDHSLMTLETFQMITIQHNGLDPNYTLNGDNTYITVDGGHIHFAPNHDIGNWGITSTDIVDTPTDENKWRLAKGDVVDADGSGCVIIKNPTMHKALVLNARNPLAPNRSEQALPASCGP
jgi:hypothetical protein